MTVQPGRRLTRTELVCAVVLYHPGILQIRAAELLADPAPGNGLKSIARAKRKLWLRDGTCQDVACPMPSMLHRHLFITPLGREVLRVLMPVP